MANILQENCLVGVVGKWWGSNSHFMLHRQHLRKQKLLSAFFSSVDLKKKNKCFKYFRNDQSFKIVSITI